MKLKKFRESLNLSQEKFAQSIGFTLSYISKLEREEVEASRNFMKKVKAVYPEIDINEIFFAN